MRVGGLALIGVGAVAGLIGLATLLPGGGTDGSTNSAAPASTAAVAPSAQAPATGAAAPAAPGPAPAPSFTGPTDDIAAPGASAGGSEGTNSGSGSGPGGSGTTAVKTPVRVYNNSTIKGLAARAADDFRGSGWPVDAVANYPYGTISTSTVYYRPGTSEQAAATTLGSSFGMRVLQRFAGLDDATPGLIVIVTNDYQRR